MKEAILVAMILVAICWPAAAGQHGLCFMVQFYAEKYGEQVAYDYAVRNQWKLRDLNAACTCLQNQPHQCAPFRERARMKRIS